MRTGLDYTGVRAGLELAGIKPGAELWLSLQIMEAEVLAAEAA